MKLDKIRRWQPKSMRPAGEIAPHPLMQRGVCGGVIAGEYDDGPPARVGANPRVGEANSGEMHLGPENNGEETSGVSRAWWASGKASELASVLGEMVAALGREVERLSIEEFVLTREREVLAVEDDVLSGMLWEAVKDARSRMTNEVCDEVCERLEGELHGLYTEGNCVEGARIELVCDRQTEARRRDALRAMRAALDGQE